MEDIKDKFMLKWSMLFLLVKEHAVQLEIRWACETCEVSHIIWVASTKNSKEIQITLRSRKLKKFLHKSKITISNS